MSVLNELISKVSKSELDEQVKIISDQIMNEERPKFINSNSEPTGPNIFLAIECSTKINVRFLCLERESKEQYIISLWHRELYGMKRKQVWEVKNHQGKADKILKNYAEILIFVKGE